MCAYFTKCQLIGMTSTLEALINLLCLHFNDFDFWFMNGQSIADKQGYTPSGYTLFTVAQTVWGKNKTNRLTKISPEHRKWFIPFLLLWINCILTLHYVVVLLL
jgi:hypothetical protein